MILPPVGYAHSRTATSGPARVQCDSIAAIARVRPWAFEPHAHAERHQLFWINKGAGRLQIDGYTRGFGPHTVAFAPAGVVHGFEFGPVSAGWVVTLPISMSVPVSLPREPVVVTANAREEQASLTAICDDINREQQSGQNGTGLALDCHGGLLSVWLQRHLTRHPHDTPEDNPTRRLLRNFVRALEVAMFTEHSVAFYGETLGVTPTHLSRVCKAINGRSANTVIQNRLILEARRRLSFGDQKVVDVSRSLGFGSAAYFTRLFSKKTGVSPTDFRKAALQTGPRPVAPREVAAA